MNKIYYQISEFLTSVRNQIAQVRRGQGDSVTLIIDDPVNGEATYNLVLDNYARNMRAVETLIKNQNVENTLMTCTGVLKGKTHVARFRVPIRPVVTTEGGPTGVSEARLSEVVDTLVTQTQYDTIISQATATQLATLRMALDEKPDVALKPDPEGVVFDVATGNVTYTWTDNTTKTVPPHIGVTLADVKNEIIERNVRLTQAEFDALPIKDPQTHYFIVA